MANSRFPNGIDTKDADVKCKNLTASDNVTAAKVEASDIVGEVANAIDIAMVNAVYTLSAAQKKATYINVATSTHAQTLILDKAKGSIVVVNVTAATNTITVKQAAGNSGIAVATGKHAIIMSTGTDVLLLAAIQ